MNKLPIPNSSQHSAALRNRTIDPPRKNTAYPEFSKDSTRLATFIHCQFLSNHQSLANLGFFYKGERDRVCCYECGVTLSQWKKDDDPLLEHIRYSPECKHLAAITDTVTLKDYKTQLHHVRKNGARHGSMGVRLVITATQEERSRVRSPQYSSFNVRLSTFARFPAINGLDVHNIAAAGFYYTGDHDLVRCYACDGGLNQWVGDEDPWDEHYRWFPNCSYLTFCNYNQTKKKYRPETRYRKSAEISLISSREDIQVVTRRLAFEKQNQKELAADLDLNTPAALAALDFGYSITAVEMAIKELRSKGLTRLTADRIIQVLIAFEDNGVRLPTNDDK